jgi:hypothetical protein
MTYAEKLRAAKGSAGSSGGGGSYANRLRAAKGGGGNTGGAKTKAASLAKLYQKADDEGILGGLKGALAAPTSVVMKALEVMDLPRAAVVSGAKELIDLADQIPGFSTADDDAEGSLDRRSGASWGDFMDQIGEHYGFGDVLREEQIGFKGDSALAEWGNRGLGFVGDVAMDPLSYVGVGVVTQGAKGLVGEAAEEGAEKVGRSLLSREDVAARLERLVDDGVDRKTVDGLQDSLFRDGAMGLPKEIRDQIGIRSGVSYGVGKNRVILPGTERIAAKVGVAGGYSRRAASKGLRWVPGMNKLPSLFEAVPDAAKVFEEQGPRVAWQHKTAWRNATDVAVAEANDLAEQLKGIHSRWAAEIDPQELVKVIEADGTSLYHLPSGAAARELQGWLEAAAVRAEDVTGQTIPRWKDYLPHRTTAEFRDLLASKGKTRGTGAKQPLQKMRTIRPGQEWLGVKVEHGSLEELEEIARNTFGDGYVQVFKDDPWELAAGYLREIRAVMQRGGFGRELVERGLAVEAKFKQIRKGAKAQKRLSKAAVKEATRSERQAAKATKKLEQADALEASARLAESIRPLLKADAERLVEGGTSSAALAAYIGEFEIPPSYRRVRKLQREVVGSLRAAGADTDRAAVDAAMGRFERLKAELLAAVTKAERTPGTAVDVAALRRELSVAEEASAKLQAILTADDAARADVASKGHVAPTQSLEDGGAQLDALDEDVNQRLDDLDNQHATLLEELEDAAAAHGDGKVTTAEVKKLRGEARQEASQVAVDARGTLGAVEGDKLPAPPAMRRTRDALGRDRWVRDGGGEWDWFDELHPREQARLRRNWMIDTSGSYSVDTLHQRWNDHFSTDLTVDEVMGEWLDLTRRADAADSFAKTGRLSTAESLGGVDVDKMLPSFEEAQINLSELYGQDPIGHLKQAIANQAERYGVRHPDEIGAELERVNLERSAHVARVQADEDAVLAATFGRGEARPLGVSTADEALAAVDQTVAEQVPGGGKNLGVVPMGNQPRGYIEDSVSALDGRATKVADALDQVDQGLVPALEGPTVAELRAMRRPIRGAVHPIHTAPEDKVLGFIKAERDEIDVLDQRAVDVTGHLDEVRAQLSAQGAAADSAKRGGIDAGRIQTELRKVNERLRSTRVPKSREELLASQAALENELAAVTSKLSAAPRDTAALTERLDGLSKEIDRIDVQRAAAVRRIHDAEAALAARKTVEMRTVGGGQITPQARERIASKVAQVSAAAKTLSDERELFNAANAARGDVAQVAAANEVALVREEMKLAGLRGERARLKGEAVQLRREAKQLFALAETAGSKELAESLRLRALGNIAEVKAGIHAVESARLWSEAATKVTPKQLEDMEKIMVGGLQEFSDGRWADPAIADAVAAAFDAMQPKKLNKALKVYDQLLSRWKAYSLLSPGFHIRNEMGGFFNNSLAGLPPQFYWGYTKAMVQMRKGGIEAITDPVWRDGMAEALRHNIVSGSDQLRDFGDIANLPGVTQGGLAGSKATVKGMNLDPTALDFAPLKLNMTVGGQVEHSLRTPLFVWKLSEGASVEEALSTVRKFHFDYEHGLSSFERNVAKRAMPFYTWTRFNFPLQVEMMMRRPGKYTAYLHAKRNLEAGLQDEPVVPSYYSTLLAIHTPFKATAGVGGEETGDIYLTPDLPFRDLSETFNVNNLIGSLSPAIKVPLELAAGKQFFSDIPFRQGAAGLSEMPKAFTPLLPILIAGQGKLGLPKVSRAEDGRWMMLETDAYKIEQSLPLFGRLRRMAPSEDRYQDRVVTTYLSVLGGVSSATNSESAQYGELLRQEKIIKDALKRRGIMSGEAA